MPMYARALRGVELLGDRGVIVGVAALRRKKRTKRWRGSKAEQINGAHHQHEMYRNASKARNRQ